MRQVTSREQNVLIERLRKRLTERNADGLFLSREEEYHWMRRAASPEDVPDQAINEILDDAGYV